MRSAIDDDLQPDTITNQSFHILLPATQKDIKLCKTIFSASVLDYPPPVVVAWGETIDPEKQEGLWGGGTHLLKISKVLEWLQNLPPERDNDLVMMMDAFDIWFQLRKDVLIKRYHRINAEANARIRRRMGRAAAVEGIEQTIVFASGKRCFPNEVHTVACWPLPPSPLPKDMWRGNTDTTVGSFPNQWSATRPKFLNSGMIMGPAKDMRALFARAVQKVTELGEEPEPDDNGSRWSEKVYHHSDQSVFNVIFGEQEYQREVIRIRHITWMSNPILRLQQLLGNDLSDTTDTLEGNPIGNVLNPPWSHVKIPHLAGKPLEFSIGLDYWQLLTFQTANSERNGNWMTYSKKPLEDQVEHHDRWDCKPHLRADLPRDILTSSPPLLGLDELTEASPDMTRRAITARDGGSKSMITKAWDAVPLYTNVCAGTIPVMLHLNGDKTMLEGKWKEMWYQPYAEQLAQAMGPQQGLSLLKGAENEGSRSLPPGSAFADTGDVLNFKDDLCKDWDFS